MQKLSVSIFYFDTFECICVKNSVFRNVYIRFDSYNWCVNTCVATYTVLRLLTTIMPMSKMLPIVCRPTVVAIHQEKIVFNLLAVTEKLHATNRPTLYYSKQWNIMMTHCRTNLTAFSSIKCACTCIFDIGLYDVGPTCSLHVYVDSAL